MHSSPRWKQALFAVCILAIGVLPRDPAQAAPRDEVAWGKLDRGLQDIYVNYLGVLARNDRGVFIYPVLHRCFRPKTVPCKLAMTIVFTGPVSALDARLHVRSVEREGVADAIIDLKDLAAVSQQANLLNFLYGEEMEEDGELGSE